MPWFSQQVATRLGVTIPSYALSKFVQGKMFKVRVLIDAARCAAGTLT